MFLVSSSSFTPSLQNASSVLFPADRRSPTKSFSSSQIPSILPPHAFSPSFSPPSSSSPPSISPPPPFPLLLTRSPVILRHVSRRRLIEQDSEGRLPLSTAPLGSAGDTLQGDSIYSGLVAPGEVSPSPRRGRPGEGNASWGAGRLGRRKGRTGKQNRRN